MMTVFDSWWIWAGFFVFVIIAIVADLVLLKNQGAHKVAFKEAAIWTVFWVAISLIFNALLWLYLDITHTPEIASTKAYEFLTGYLIEKALSVDNIFAFYMVFAMFRIPAEFQKRALIIGIVGSIILRTIMILLGSLLIARFSWILYIFGVFLIYTGIQMLRHRGEEAISQDSGMIVWLKKHVRFTQDFDGEKFFLIKSGVKYATPIFLAVATIGMIDIVFAVDSIPAIFAITYDPFIVLTSNIFAVLGLRALYFLLADMVERFRFLPVGLSIILIFIGAKMLINYYYHIPITISLIVVAAILLISVILSQIVAVREKKKETPSISSISSISD